MLVESMEQGELTALYVLGENPAQSEADNGRTLGLLQGLDARYPGMRHRIVDEQGRIRKHIRFFVNGEMAERLDRALGSGDEVMIVAALSGG